MACICAITIASSNWNNGSNAGTFYWNLNNASSNSNRNISTHLLCGAFKIYFDMMHALPLGKTHSNEQDTVLVDSRFSNRTLGDLLHNFTNVP
jgi:hypothetical protein